MGIIYTAEHLLLSLFKVSYFVCSLVTILAVSFMQSFINYCRIYIAAYDLSHRGQGVGGIN